MGRPPTLVRARLTSETLSPDYGDRSSGKGAGGEYRGENGGVVTSDGAPERGWDGGCLNKVRDRRADKRDKTKATLIWERDREAAGWSCKRTEELCRRRTKTILA